MKIGITGGIGSGKSYVCQRLIARGYEVYDCDSAAKRLMRTSPEIRQQLTALIGPETYIDNTLNKKKVAEFLLVSEDNAKAVDAIVHPAVFCDFEASGMKWMESAILYESGAYRLVDKTIVVTAPEEVRIQRVMQRDSISREKVLEWMARQMPQEEVRRRADFEIINDGEANIEQQLNKILRNMKETIFSYCRQARPLQTRFQRKEQPDCRGSRCHAPSSARFRHRQNHIARRHRDVHRNGRCAPDDRT